MSGEDGWLIRKAGVTKGPLQLDAIRDAISEPGAEIGYEFSHATETLGAWVTADRLPKRAAQIGVTSHRRFRCPYCQSPAGLEVKTVATAGTWLLFVVLLIVFFPLCWLAFFVGNKVHRCKNCNAPVGS